MRTEYKRPNGTTYGENLVKTEFYCPNCGKQNVMDEDCDGDYYEGSTMYCLDCKCSFTMPSFKIDNEVKIVSVG